MSEEEIFEGLCHICGEELEETMNWVFAMLSKDQIEFLKNHPALLEGAMKNA